MDIQELIDRVIEQIKQDVINEDYTALDLLLGTVSVEELIEYLPEENV